ncbi:MAG: carboxypeptidase regulatory-like domain-containing protein [Chloroflexota bacterium]|nr:carboxypeptidase regulatory-like domain-containing protein [Chloroflexota bacterium]
MRARLRIAAAVALPVLLALGVAAAAAGSGTISGQVTSHTAGAAPIGATDVVLHAFAKESGDEIGTGVASRTDASGRFAFTGVDTGTDRGYVVTASHAGVTYSSELVIFQDGTTTATADVAVYETTDAADWIWLRQQHLIVTPDVAARTLHVVEIAIVENGGDRTFVGKDAGSGVETVRLPLPAQAYDVDVSAPLAHGSAMRPGEIVYSGALVPGETQLSLGYALPYGGSAYTLGKLLPLDTDAIDVLVEDVGLSARSAQLSDPTTVAAGGKKYVRLSGRGIAAGTLVSIALAPPEAALSPAAIARAAVPAAGALALVGVAGYLVVPRLRRRRGGRPRATRGARRPRTDPEGTDGEDEIVPEGEA